MAQYRTFERTIAELTAQGYEVIWERGNEAQLRRHKRFSFWWFLFWTVFSLGILFWLYPLWHWAKRDELVLLRIEEGRLLVTSNRWQLLRTISAPVRAYSRWAGRRQSSWTKALAYVTPLAVALVAIIVAGAVAGTGGGGEGEEAAKPTGTAAVTAAPAPKPKPNEATLAVGAAAELKDGVRLRIDNILDPCIVGSTPFQEVEPGTRMVVYQLTFENLANEQQTILGQFGAKDATGFEYDDTFGTCEGERDLPFCFLEDVVTTTECEVAFEVREGQQIVELRYDPNPFTTTDIVFRVP
jgi:signal transduction histidine kinase